MYRKLKAAELIDRGLSPKSERYISEAGDLISKRQYQKIQRGGVTYTQFVKEVLSGKRKGVTLRPRKPKVEKPKKTTGFIRRYTSARQTLAEYLNLTMKQTLRLARESRKKGRRVMIVAMLATAFFPDVQGSDGKPQSVQPEHTYRAVTPSYSDRVIDRGYIMEKLEDMAEIEPEDVEHLRFKVTLLYPKAE